MGSKEGMKVNGWRTRTRRGEIKYARPHKRPHIEFWTFHPFVATAAGYWQLREGYITRWTERRAVATPESMQYFDCWPSAIFTEGLPGKPRAARETPWNMFRNGCQIGIVKWTFFTPAREVP